MSDLLLNLVSQYVAKVNVFFCSKGLLTHRDFYKIGLFFSFSPTILLLSFRAPSICIQLIHELISICYTFPLKYSTCRTATRPHPQD